jgi:hypothetical protein
MPQPGERRTRKDGKAYAEWNGSAWVEYSVGPAAKLPAQEEISLREARDSAQMMSEVTEQAERFSELNRKAATGPIYKIPFAEEVASVFKPELAQMNALTARMAPAQRVPGSGTTSDRDLALFLRAIPNTDRMGSANGEITRDMRAMADKRKERAYFFDRFAQQNGTLKGAQEAFDRQWNARSRTPARQSARTQGKGWKILGVE